MNQIFPGVFRDGKYIYTKNLVPGRKVYGEKLIKDEKDELREWDPTRSKLGAAILNGLKELPIKDGSVVLYLGASTGTTPSHVSDIARNNGFVYGIEFAERVFRNLLDLCRERKNIAPILADARKMEYEWVEDCDVVFTDIADPQETNITIANAEKFLKKGGYVMIAVKSQSIDVTKKPEQVYEEEENKLKKAGYTIIQTINLEPYEQKHSLICAQKSF